MSLCHKLRFSNTYIFVTQCRRPQIFQTMNSVRSNSLSMKYQGCPPAGCQHIGIRKLEFLAKTHFLFGFLKVCHFLADYWSWAQWLSKNISNLINLYRNKKIQGVVNLAPPPSQTVNQKSGYIGLIWSRKSPTTLII